MEKSQFTPYVTHNTNSESALLKISEEHFNFMNLRRTIREFSPRPIPMEVLENLIMAASTAPSGANKQPWTFCVVTNAELKTKIKIAAEQEEFESYNGRMTDQWIKDLKEIGTTWQKPFLEIAPALIIVFKRSYEFVEVKKVNNYYTSESVGIACGFLLQAIHACGLVALTHTPSPMDFLTKILDRPQNEKPFLLIPVGYAAENTTVPNIERKKKEDVIHCYN